MASRIKDIDRGWKKHGRMIRKQAFTDPHVKVGIIGPDTDKIYSEKKITTIEVASAHEFGLGNQHERSFIRASYDKYYRTYMQLLRRYADLILQNKMTQRRALGLLGEKALADMKNYMRLGIPPDKADGNPARLKDTGQLYGSLIYQVESV